MNRPLASIALTPAPRIAQCQSLVVGEAPGPISGAWRSTMFDEFHRPLRADESVRLIE